MTDHSQTTSLPPLPDPEQPLAFDDDRQEKCFDHLCQLFPQLLNRKSTPKPMAITFRQHLETARKANPLPPDITTALKKTIKCYVRSDGYLRAIMKGGPRYNTEGKEEGAVSEEEQQAAYKLWQKRYDPNYTPPPQPEKKQKAKAPAPQPKKKKKAVTPPPPKTPEKPTPKAKPKLPPKKPRPTPKPRLNGYILKYLPDRAFGFLTWDNGERSVFFHKRAFIHQVEDHQLVPGRCISFQVKSGKKGPNSLEAIQIQLEAGHTWHDGRGLKSTMPQL